MTCEMHVVIVSCGCVTLTVGCILQKGTKKQSKWSNVSCSSSLQTNYDRQLWYNNLVLAAKTIHVHNSHWPYWKHFKCPVKLFFCYILMKDNDGLHQNMHFVEAVHMQTVCHLFVN